ncbi:MAG: D-alanine--D-alanine ligase [Pseudomonadota bacterium]
MPPSPTQRPHTRPHTRPKVAVFFGGQSPEHDVSIVTGLQVLHAIDQTRYAPFPVYIAPNGTWLVGDALANRCNYWLNAKTKATLTPVTLDFSNTRGRGRLLPHHKSIFQSMFQRPQPIDFDIALPAMHGLYGEDGNLQGCFEIAHLPYAGPRTHDAAIFMNKATTKRLLQQLDIPALAYTVIQRPQEGLLLKPDALKQVAKDITFPACVKPNHLGSSIGVAKVTSAEELNAVLPAIFKYDSQAIVEPFVDNLVEYNVAIRRTTTGEIITSAIEQPKSSAELLDFKEKYLSGGADKLGNKIGSKTSANQSGGMASLTRIVNPKISSKMQANIRQWSTTLYQAVEATGAPRVDFLCNQKTGELWLNEVNPFPGSVGYYLWEAAPQPILFTQLLNELLDEAQSCHHSSTLPEDPTPEAGRLFVRQ